MPEPLERTVRQDRRVLRLVSVSLQSALKRYRQDKMLRYRSPRQVLIQQRYSTLPSVFPEERKAKLDPQEAQERQVQTEMMVCPPIRYGFSRATREVKTIS